MSASCHLGLDIGGTASRWVLCADGGVEIARGQAGGATGHIFNPAELARLKAAFEEISQAVAAAGTTATTITLGMTGFGPAVSDDVKALLATAFGTEQANIIVVDDVVLAYLANFEPGQGHLISAGTGSIGVHIGADGSFTRVGGRGILIDDAGAGSWIALTALDQIYRELDLSGSFSGVQKLADALFKHVGGPDWGDVRQFVYAGDRGRIGTLAVAVAEAANGGDATALRILQQAGVELARLGQALNARIGSRSVGLIGGVLKLHPVIEQEFRAQMAGHEVIRLAADASLAAARIQAMPGNHWRNILSSLA